MNKECIGKIKIEDINQTGMRFTWNQRPNSKCILKKLDRGSEGFINSFTNAYADFQPCRISDHSPAILKIRFQKGQSLKRLNLQIL